MWTPILAFLCGLALASPNKDPFVAAQAMLAPIPDAPEHIAKSEVAAEIYREMVASLNEHREADHNHKTFCYYKEINALLHDRGDDIDERAIVHLGKAQRCAAHSAAGGEKTGKASKGGHDRLEGASHPRATVTVYYGTDRVRADSGDHVRYGGAARCSASATGGDPSCVDFGTVEVNIPDVHKIGHLEGHLPTFWSSAPDPTKDLFAKEPVPMSAAEWSKMLKADVGNSGGSIFVFIHGYYNTFDDAARRAGQMAYDLRFDGVPMIYSWGSAGTLRGYWADEKAVEAAVPHLADFLKKAGASGSTDVHILAHSMGNRAIAGVIKQFSDDKAFTDIHIASITLAAADIDAEIFKNEIAPKLAKVTDHVAIYVSEHDEALKASRMLHQAETPRLGEVPLVFPGVQTIDVTSATSTDSLGHSYYGSVPTLIDDINQFWHGASPASRSWLTETSGYWTLSK